MNLRSIYESAAFVRSPAALVAYFGLSFNSPSRNKLSAVATSASSFERKEAFSLVKGSPNMLRYSVVAVSAVPLPTGPTLMRLLRISWMCLSGESARVTK